METSVSTDTSLRYDSEKQIDTVGVSSQTSDSSVSSVSPQELLKPPAKEEDKSEQIEPHPLSLEARKNEIVSLAKRNFIRSIVRLALAATGVAVASVITAVTGGAGIPLVALAGVSLLLATGDLICAYRDWSAKKAGKAGLRCQDDGLANFLSLLADKVCQLAGKVRKENDQLDAKIKKAVLVTNLLIRYAIGLSALAIGFSPLAASGLPLPLNLVSKIVGAIELPAIEKPFQIMHEMAYGELVSVVCKSNRSNREVIGL